MPYILIYSCPECDPDTWIVEGESKHVYKCKTCRQLVKLILRRKEVKTND